LYSYVPYRALSNGLFDIKAFNGVIFAVIRRIVSQHNFKIIFLSAYSVASSNAI
jgi:hypothetical protein